MAKLCFDPILTHIHGRLVGSSRVVFKHRDDTGTNFSSDLPTFTGSATTKQLAVREKMRQAQTQVAAVMADAEQRATYETAFKQQKKKAKAGCKTYKKYGTLRGYIFAKVYKTL